MSESHPRSLPLEVALVVGLPVLTLVAGALMLALAFGQGSTPAAASAPVGMHGG